MTTLSDERLSAIAASAIGGALRDMLADRALLDAVLDDEMTTIERRQLLIAHRQPLLDQHAEEAERLVWQMYRALDLITARPRCRVTNDRGRRCIAVDGPTDHDHAFPVRSPMDPR